MAADLFDVSDCEDLCSGLSMAAGTEWEVSGNALLGVSRYSHGDVLCVNDLLDPM